MAESLSEDEDVARALAPYLSEPARLFSRLRRRAGLSQKDFGERAGGLGQTTISGWETGRRALPAAALFAAAEWAGLDLRAVDPGSGYAPTETVDRSEFDSLRRDVQRLGRRLDEYHSAFAEWEAIREAT